MTDPFFAVVAEVAIAFAGFSGLIGLFARTRGSSLSLRETPQFWIMIEGALGCLFFALLPLFLIQVNHDESDLWRFSSALLAPFVIAFQVHGLALHRRAGGGRLPRPIAMIGAVTIPASILGSLLLVANAIGLLGQGVGWPYSLVLFGSLAAVGLNFVLLLQQLAADL